MLDDKIRDACHRIEELYYETNGKCYVRTPFMMKVMEYDFCPSCGAKMDGVEE